MDLGIAGRWALVCAASKGLGRGCAEALAQEGVNLVLNARSSGTLEQTAATIRTHSPGIRVLCVAGDITAPEVQHQALHAAPSLDILINNAGGPPPGDFRDFTPDDWHKAFTANTITPISLIKACVDDMTSRGFGRIVNITSSSVKAPIAALGLSNGARSGLTGFVAGLARQPQLAARNVTLNNLLPGKFLTDRLRGTLQHAVETTGEDMEELIKRQQTAIPAGRFGTAAEFGAFCAFLCSAQASYYTGQNVLLDGGAYPGTF